MTLKTKLSEQVIQQIRQDIASGKYKVGDKIPAEPELMQLYEVGRSTIREAIKALALSGTLKVQQGSGTFINEQTANEPLDQKLSRADFEEVNAVRSLLEKEIVRLAAVHRNADQLKDIAACLEKRRSAIQEENRQQCMDADIAFHMAIAKASSNTVLADLYERFTSIIRDFFTKRETKGISYFAMSHHLHESLYKAIQSKSAKQAELALQRILDNNY
ncbi:transcriptional regulator for pyruvate dehydrogenase complex, GntR family protein [Pedobacter sp. BAL39]|uniref:FadR/GntR family transcriptional regulator n=1 Tax=Pedobacter sp. BAL39 TaxID=391596 RepID=UPI000155A2AF|nr:FadR/GntR family transcriptional regulator [Pedobacter sp. BAL39]EDM34018.1 transcriptional regulator for pyruvate dehydrogenase complex, GntR family protein [Pedobacter sp. BAL39]